jgi:hypothetical protein
MSPEALARRDFSPEEKENPSRSRSTTEPKGATRLLPDDVPAREGAVEEYLRLLDQGIDVCTRWEEWSDRQFAALAQGDIAALVAVSARQARLVDTFFRLEYQWQHVRRLVAESESGVLPEVVARREVLLFAAERVFAANYRNLRALNAVSLLATATEPLVSQERAGVYDRQGHKGGHKAPVRKMVDREG